VLLFLKNRINGGSPFYALQREGKRASPFKGRF
jgi:hypothetical protein